MYDNRWYVARMIKNHILTGYKEGMEVYFKFDGFANAEIAMVALGDAAVAEKMGQVIIYDGNSSVFFRTKAKNAGSYIESLRDQNNRPIMASEQFGIQWNFINKCKQ